VGVRHPPRPGGCHVGAGALCADAEDQEEPEAIGKQPWTLTTILHLWNASSDCVRCRIGSWRVTFGHYVNARQYFSGLVVEVGAVSFAIHRLMACNR